MSEHVTTNSAVDDRLDEFIETITESKPYQQFVDSQQELKADDEAQELLREFQTKQQQLQRDGFDQETMGELRELKTEMEDNETISDVRAAEAELVALLEQTNDIISEKIGQEFAQTTGGGCC
ncbi:halo-CC-star protein HcsL [Natronorubrum sp. A-ect3]|uniref:halo-CC-star protein HcsL n=1 Tax=Natronorubrum sp. A-ect3 TaxID=3242698 RepID=UPI00359CCB8E